MPASRPPRIKIRVLIIILSARANAQLENDIDGSTHEIISAALCRVMPLMLTSEANWSINQATVWTCVETIYDAFENAEPNEDDLVDMSKNLETALTAAGL